MKLDKFTCLVTYYFDDTKINSKDNTQKKYIHRCPRTRTLSPPLRDVHELTNFSTSFPSFTMSIITITVSLRSCWYFFKQYSRRLSLLMSLPRKDHTRRRKKLSRNGCTSSRRSCSTRSAKDRPSSNRRLILR